MATLQPSVMATLPDWPPQLRTLISAAEACNCSAGARFGAQRGSGTPTARPRSLPLPSRWAASSIDHGDGEIQIDRTAAAQHPRIYLDEDQQPVGIGEPGELYLAAPVARLPESPRFYGAALCPIPTVRSRRPHVPQRR